MLSSILCINTCPDRLVVSAAEHDVDVVKQFSSVQSVFFRHGGSFSLKFVDEKEEVPKNFREKLQLQSRQHGSCRISFLEI